MRYKVLLPETSPEESVRLWRLGLFARGDARELELTDAEAKSMKAKGLRVTKVAAKVKEVEHG